MATMIGATQHTQACPSADAIVRLIEGRARSDEADAIDLHVDRCAHCFELLAQLGAQQRGDQTVGPLGPAHYDDEAPLRAGDHVGRHIIGELIGRGGMGLVYAAYDPVLRRSIAIKLMRPVAGREPTANDRAQLRHEAQALARLSHPNVVPIHDLGQHGGRLWVAMERVDGVTLRAWALANPGSHWRERIALLRSAGSALAAAHEAGIVHRDFKPDNVMVGRDGRVRVLDFGLARVRAIEALVESTLVSGPDDEGETPTRGAAGTPAYMAPEQHLGAEIDARTDQFAFAVTAWELLFGERPFAGTTAAAIATSVALGDIRRPSARGLEGFAVTLRRALAVVPAERYPDMQALLGQLGVDPRRRGRRMRVAFGLVALAGGVVAVDLWRDAAARTACADAAAHGLDMPSEPPSVAVTAALGEGSAASRAGARFDDVAEQWRALELEGCLAKVASPSDREHDEARRCRAEAGAAWSTAAHVVVDADATVRARVLEILDDLPVLDACKADTTTALASHPETLAESAALRERLSRVVVLSKASRDDEANAEVREIVERARELGDEATLADALTRSGEVAEALGDFAQAEAHYVDAFWIALRNDRHPTAIAAAANVAQLVGNRLARIDEARDWVRHAEAILARTDERQPARRGVVVLALAAIDHTDGRVDASLAGFEQGLALSIEAHGAASGNAATLRANLAAALLDAGRFDDALAQADQALESHVRAWGPDHPAVARDHLTRANTLLALQRFDEADAEYRRAESLAARVLPTGHPDLVAYYTGLGLAANAQGRSDEALRWHEQALVIQERSVGPDHPDVGLIVNNIGSVLSASGRDAEAVPQFERSLAIFRHAYGDDHTNVASAQHDLALAHHGLDHEAEAIMGYDSAIATWSRALGGRHAMVGRARVNLGNALLEHGEHERAFAEYRLAVEINEEAVGTDDLTTARAWSRLGLALAEYGRPEEAIAPLQRAIALRKDGPDLERVAELRFALAKALPPDDREQAEREAKAAAAAYRQLEDATKADEIAAWLRTQ